MSWDPITELKPQGMKAIQLMKDRGMRIRAINIVYFEGIDTNLKTLNNDRLDFWNDVRCLITDEGDVLMAAQATTEPGAYYTYNRMNHKGAFRIQLSTQFLDAWGFGMHFDQWALVQIGNIAGHRDDNEDGFRTGDLIDIGGSFGVNQHTVKGLPDRVGRWSAGCLVGRYWQTHKLFMDILKSTGNVTFDTVVFDGKLLL